MFHDSKWRGAQGRDDLGGIVKVKVKIDRYVTAA